MRLYHNIEEIETCPNLIGYVRPLRRAWVEFDLSLVLCVNNTPTLFYSESQKVLSPEDIWKLHRTFWNQGIASVLTIRDSKTVYILSGLEPPQKADDVSDFDQIPAIVKTFASNKFENEDLFESISNGEFYRVYSKKFSSTGLIDHKLNENLKTLRNFLVTNSTNPVDELIAHNFICRLLFVCYLMDRGIYSISENTQFKHLHEVLSSLASDELADFLFDHFVALKKKFNGSMFDQDLSHEKEIIAPHLPKIVSFLRGDDVSQKQTTLGFWAYDFQFIPIETISGIYETFLTDEDRDSKGAHYTPRLLAELTLDVACENIKDWSSLKFLDPCCGSGVFIVTLFNRLSTIWELKNKRIKGEVNYYQLKADALLGILKNQIRGIDLKETAGKLACFSLYVALLDSFDPADIYTYIEKTGSKLPTLFRSKDCKDPDIPVINEDNSLQPELFAEFDFDLVVGNPPWGGRGESEKSLDFMNDADRFFSPKGQACFLLPSKNFLNLNSDKFQEKWFSRYIVDRVVQLADYRFILFPTAKAPCMLVRFRSGKFKPEDFVLYDTPKVDFSTKRKGFIRLFSNDRKYVTQNEILIAAKQCRAHEIWKRMLWGTQRDRRLLNYLSTFRSLNSLAGTIEENKRWLKGQGIIPDRYDRSESPDGPWWKEDILFIDAKSKELASSHVLLESDCDLEGGRFKKLLRNRKKIAAIFDPPHVLVSQGFGKVSFCNFQVLFQHSLQSIHGPEEDSKLLAFLAAYLQSSLAKYFCFHTSSKLGIERDVVRFEELLNLPFPLPEDSPSERSEEIIDEVYTIYNNLENHLNVKFENKYSDSPNSEWIEFRSKQSEQLKIKLDKLVFEYFGLLEPERMLVEDSVQIYYPSATPRSADQITFTQQPINKIKNGLELYADVLSGTLNSWAIDQDSEWRACSFGGYDTDSNVAVVRIDIVSNRENTNFTPIKINGRIYRELLDSFKDTCVVAMTERQVVGFLKESFYVLRPLSQSNWTRSRALNDADEFFSQFLKMKGIHTA